jgi:acyl dehydratase
MAGLHFEEFEVGQVFRHALRRTVTETDNILFSTMTLNPQPLHIDRHFCETETEWGQPLMNSLFTLGLMIGISVHDTTLGTTIANLGMSDVRFPSPLFQGDTVHVTTEVVGKRESGRDLTPGSWSSSTRRSISTTRLSPSAAAGVHAAIAGLMRSLLFVPGDNRRKLDKALASGADALIIDLEDSVAAENKGEARRLALGYLREVVRRPTVLACLSVSTT